MCIPLGEFGIQSYPSESFIVGCRVNYDDRINRVQIGSNNFDKIIVQTTANGDRSNFLVTRALNGNARYRIVTEPAEIMRSKCSTNRKRVKTYYVKNNRMLVFLITRLVFLIIIIILIILLLSKCITCKLWRFDCWFVLTRNCKRYQLRMAMMLRPQWQRTG